MEWKQLLSTKRQRDHSNGKIYKSADLRSEFEKDYHRIVGSASFRRLQDKTQVFPLDKSDFIRTRLTHSLEVSSIAKSLGQNIGENILTYKKDLNFTVQMKEDMCNILQCSGLIHDIGNPPFGHFGEEAIRKWFQIHLPKIQYQGATVHDTLLPQMREDFYHFEGNAQALRLVTKLHFLVDENGMNLTYALLNTIIKYPVSSLEINKKSGNIKDKKMGYYFADGEIFEDIQRVTGTNGRRHPLTFILEAADDIAYKTADIEDAFVKGFLSYHTLREELKVLKANTNEADSTGTRIDPLEILDRQYERGLKQGVVNIEEYAVKNWIVRIQGFIINCATFGFTTNYKTIMAGEYKKDLFYGTYGEQLMNLLGDLAYRRVFSSNAIYKVEVKESVILNHLMNLFVGTVLKYDTDMELDALDVRVMSFVSDNYINIYHHRAAGKSEAEKLYLRLLLVTDYICGMTDSYALRLYQEIQGLGDI
ncbi:MAG: deoxyguanosinetriphosphate triphosphohydrolase [Eubacteriales bacterium]